jgi:type VI secretion system secreted protein VgrG
MADTAFNIKSDSPVNDDLMFWSIVGHEALSRPSTYELSVLSKNQKIEAKDILGRAFDVEIEFLDADRNVHKRHCKGHAIRFVRVGQVGRHYRYEISLQSWFGLLSKRVNSRWHQDELVLKVFDSVLEDSPIKRIKKTETKNVKDAHHSRLYLPQYQESDYQFLSRLLEDEGIYYWFDAHGAMCLSDDSCAVGEALPVTDKLRYAPSGVSDARYNEITQWVSSRQLDTGHFDSRDTNYKHIRTKLSADKRDPDGHEMADLEVFEFTGGFFSGAQSDHITGLRMEELVTRRERHWAQTSWPDVTAGKNFTFENDPDGTRDGDYLIAACSFVVSHPGYEGMGLKEEPRSIATVLQKTLEADAVNSDVRAAYTELIRSSPALRTGVPGTRAF